MSGFTTRDGELFADDIPCADIASQAGTPCYVYSADKITEQFTKLSTSLVTSWTGIGTPLIAFACKANSNLAVIKLLGSLGAGADVVSGGEIDRAMAAGIPVEKIIFSGVGKTYQELQQALELGVHQINLETAGELDSIIEISKKLGIQAPVAFRYTPNVHADTHAKISTGEDDHKFGLLEDEILELYERASASGVIATKGISVHIGSQLFDLEAFEQAFNKVATLIKKLRDKNLEVSIADIGGGLGISYEGQKEFDLTGYTQLINRIFSSLNVSIALEPGRFLVAESGALLTRVTYIKERPERRFVITDAGMNDLIRPTLYEAFHPVLPVLNTSGKPVLSDIVGPVCETGDYFALNRELPPIVTGDILAVLCAGAYGSVMSSQYNSRPLIPEVMTRGKDWAIVREGQKISDIWANEVIPGWLK
jgi:diaminopimelate decarboxylase